MLIKQRILERAINAALIITLFIFTSIYSCAGQTLKFIGYEGAFGTRSYSISSSIPEINSMHVSQQGGTVGVVLGSDLLRATIHPLGYYFSTSCTPELVKLSQKSVSLNFYPLQYLRNHNKHAADIYVTSGVSYDKIIFFGYYLNTDQAIDIRKPVPRLGHLSQIKAFSGGGIEFHLPYQKNFVHLFVEVLYSQPIRSDTDKASFMNTAVKDFICVNIGVKLGDLL